MSDVSRILSAIEQGDPAAEQLLPLVAHFPTGDWKAAIDALQTSLKLQGDNSYDLLFLPMSHWQRGEHEPARHQFEKAIQWMQKHPPQDEQLLSFRAGEEELLGIKAKVP